MDGESEGLLHVKAGVILGSSAVECITRRQVMHSIKGGIASVGVVQGLFCRGMKVQGTWKPVRLWAFVKRYA